MGWRGGAVTLSFRTFRKWAVTSCQLYQTWSKFDDGYKKIISPHNGNKYKKQATTEIAYTICHSSAFCAIDMFVHFASKFQCQTGFKIATYFHLVHLYWFFHLTSWRLGLTMIENGGEKDHLYIQKNLNSTKHYEAPWWSLYVIVSLIMKRYKVIKLHAIVSL